MNDALMMKMAARNGFGINTNYDDEPDSEDIRRERERRKSPVKRALKTHIGKSMIGGMILPGIGGPLGHVHAHLQNKGAKMRTRHMSDHDLDDAYYNRARKK